VTFKEVLTQAMAMLRCQGRVSYRALKCQFDLDDSHLADLTAEIIDVHHGFCRKVRFLGQNPKIGYQKFNDLQTAKLLKKQLCDRTRSHGVSIRISGS
jgi:hypothetical protein